MAYYNGRRVFGVSVGGSVVKKSTGKDSVVNVTTDDDVARENTASGDYAIAFGSRNVASGSESGALGGGNTVSGEDAFAVGYKNTSTENQSFTGGYKNTNHGRETIVFGNQNTQKAGNNSRYNAIFGRQNTVGQNTRQSLVAGYNNSIPDYAGGINEHIYLLGTNNVSEYNNTALIGEGLRSVERGQFVIGKYNKGTENCWFEVGNGSDNSHRDTAFAVLDYSGTKSIKIGNTELTEAQLQALLALLS